MENERVKANSNGGSMPSHKTAKLMENSKAKKTKLKVIAAIALLVCFVVAVFLFQPWTNETKVAIKSPTINPGKYNILVDDWNRSVINARLDTSHYLPDSDPQGVIKCLNGFVRPFYEPHSHQIESELQDIIQGRKYSFFVFYYGFLKKHRLRDKITFTAKQDSLEIMNELIRLTGQNSVNTRAVGIVAAMGNPCFFLKNFRHELYQRGMSRNIQTCRDIVVDKEKYPHLHDLVNMS